MNKILLCITFCFFISFLILFHLYSKAIKKIDEKETENIKLKSDIEWEKTKAQVKQEVENETRKQKEKISTGSKSDRINAAGSILQNNRS